jgi:hypothetical protein
MAHLTVNRPSTTTQQVPAGENLLQTGKAKLTLGGISGWMSNGTVQVTPAELTNGKLDDLTRPWLSLDELFWDAATGRQVWAEINFSEPTDVQAITVHEDSHHPESWPNEGLVQVWDEKEAAWKTAAFGVFLKGPVNTYQLDLKAVRKLRYLPWSDYYRNFWTSEIEIR